MNTINEEYNGWTNRETWLVNLWLSNDQYTNTKVYDIANDKKASVYARADTLKDFTEDLLYQMELDTSQYLDGFITDLYTTALYRCNWSEIIESNEEN